MTWRNRLKLLIGSVLVLVVVAACTVVFTKRQSEATSTTATIVAQQYPIGTDYAGTVTAVAVKPGDRVVAGQPLLTVQSASLRADLKRGLITKASIGHTVTNKGRITFTAPVAGTVSRVGPVMGGFVPAGTALAVVDRTGSLAVSAKVLLTATDYSRLAHGAAVELILPNQRSITGHVQRTAVTTTPTGQAQAQLTVASSGLRDGAENGLVAAGTPVTARVHLRDDGLLAGLEDRTTALLRKVGL